MKKLIFVTVLLGLFLVATALAQEPGDTLWTRAYGGSGDDKGMRVQQTSDGGSITAGYTSSFGAGGHDVYLIKTDGNGGTLWSRTYGGTDGDYGQSVQQTADGGYIVAGYTLSFGAGSNDVWLIRTDADGDTLWTHTYGGYDRDNGYFVQQTSDGGYIVAGSTQPADWDIYVVKTDPSGNPVWTHTYGGTGNDFGQCVQQTSDGGYVLSGYTNSFGAGGNDFYLLKTDASGDTLWTRTYGGTGADWGYEVRQTSDGGYVLSGYTNSFGAGGNDAYLVKTNANGDTLWTRTYGGTGGDLGFSVQQTADGGYVIAGETAYGPGGNCVYLVKTDANGDTLWTRWYGGDDSDQARSVSQTADGAYLVTGYTSSFGGGAFDVYLLKIAGEALQPDVSIEIVPDDPPVTVPQGGSFGYTGTVTNNTEDPQTTDMWVMAVGPTKEVYGPFRKFQDVPLDPSQSRSRDLNQRVANLAPLGFYNYIAYCGDYPSTVMDSSFFQVEVIAGAPGGGEDIGWVLTGSFSEGELTELPSDFALSGNYPNPFNASTLISYEVPATAHVKLEVYNLFGQKVATLVDGQQEAGYESVSWDASEVSSGLYFYKLTAGEFTEVKRMTLLR